MTSTAGLLDLRGGHPAVDLVNTVAWRGDETRRIDHLAGYLDLVSWSRHAKVLTTGEAEKLRGTAYSENAAALRELARAKRLREALHNCWTGDPRRALASVTAVYRTALRRRDLRADSAGSVVWVDREVSVTSPVDRLAVAAVDLLTETRLDGVKRCGDAACGWLFLDGSHRQNRRWCSAADCGNRDRARRHYERART